MWLWGIFSEVRRIWQAPALCDRAQYVSSAGNGGQMKRSNISWADFSGNDLNWLTGCQKVSEGCRFCWAEAIYKRFGRDFSKVTYDSRKLRRALRATYPQDGNVRGAHARPLCFVCDTSDFFCASPAFFIPKYAIEFMGQRADVDWAILTKRPENIPADIVWPDNVWLGVTAENQARADERIPLLLATGAKVKFVCVEPMLGPVELPGLCGYGKKPPSSADCAGCDDNPDGCETCRTIGHCASCCDHNWCDGHFAHHLSWVICGSESGPHRRPFDVAWAEALYQECKDAGIPFFYKQGSALRPGQDDLLGGRKVKEWPR
jgi:protein gp37